MVEPQREGVLTEGLGARLLKVLHARDAQPTIVRFHDGRDLEVLNVAWGRDIGDLWEHVTTDCSPPQEGRETYFFYMSEVVSIIDPETGQVLAEQTPAPGEV